MLWGQVGVQEPREVAKASLVEFNAFWRVNVCGTLHCVQAVTEAMKQQAPRTIAGRNGPRDVGRGVIINLGSCNSYVATQHIVQYTTSKHAVLGLTRNAGECRIIDFLFYRTLTLLGTLSSRQRGLWHPGQRHLPFVG